MKNISVYDPPLCCPTGVCGPSVDPKLVRFAADLDWLKKKGVRVERFNLAQQPGAFAQNAIVRAELTAKGNSCLPLVLVNGEVAASGGYPNRNELANLVGVEYEDAGDVSVAPAGSFILPMAGSGGACCPGSGADGDGGGC